MLMKNLFSTAQVWSTGSFKVSYVHFWWDLALYMWVKGTSSHFVSSQSIDNTYRRWMWNSMRLRIVQGDLMKVPAAPDRGRAAKIQVCIIYGQRQFPAILYQFTTLTTPTHWWPLYVQDWEGISTMQFSPLPHTSSSLENIVYLQFSPGLETGWRSSVSSCPLLSSVVGWHTGSAQWLLPFHSCTCNLTAWHAD